MFNNKEGFSYTLALFILLKKNDRLPSATFQGDEGD